MKDMKRIIIQSTDSGIARQIMCVLLMLGLFCVGVQKAGAENTGIRCTISASSQRILPYAPVDVLITLHNDTDEQKKVEVYLNPRLGIGRVSDGAVSWKQYAGENEIIQEPPPPSVISLAPHQSRTWTLHLDFEHTGMHVFRLPGTYKIKGGLDYEQKLVTDTIDIVVEQPQGIDARAYEFLRTTKLPQLSEWTVNKYPYNNATVQSFEKFIKEYNGSRYSDMVRLGLALMWLRGVEGKADEDKAATLLVDLSEKATPAVRYRAAYYLGMLFMKRGDQTGAGVWFQKALDENPDPYIKHLAQKALHNNDNLRQE